MSLRCRLFRFLVPGLPVRMISVPGAYRLKARRGRTASAMGSRDRALAGWVMPREVQLPVTNATDAIIG